MPLGDTETWPHYISHFLAGNYIPGCVVSRKHEFARGTCCDVIKYIPINFCHIFMIFNTSDFVSMYWYYRYKLNFRNKYHKNIQKINYHIPQSNVWHIDRFISVCLLLVVNKVPIPALEALFCSEAHDHRGFRNTNGQLANSGHVIPSQSCKENYPWGSGVTREESRSLIGQLAGAVVVVRIDWSSK